MSKDGDSYSCIGYCTFLAVRRFSVKYSVLVVPQLADEIASSNSESSCWFVIIYQQEQAVWSFSYQIKKLQLWIFIEIPFLHGGMIVADESRAYMWPRARFWLLGGKSIQTMWALKVAITRKELKHVRIQECKC